MALETTKDGAAHEETVVETPVESCLSGTVAIISDIHGNLQALEAALADIKTQGVSEILCLGDIVGYGGNPVECLHLIRTLGIQCVKGNHDSYVTDSSDLPSHSKDFIRACEWTRQQIGQKDREWLQQLPMTFSAGDYELVHSSLNQPEQWNYLETYDSAHFKNQTKGICFVGHTHQPKMWIEGTERPIVGDGIEAIRNGQKQVVNVGSVGQPRDENSKACYALFRREKGDIWWRRVSYDIAGAQGAIIAAGLPARYAARLEIGK